MLAATTSSGCSEPPTGDTDASATGTSSTGTSSTGTTSDEPTGSTGTATTLATTTAATTAAATTDESSTGPIACPKNVVLMGYWPPTNEMLRPWSTHPAQNPDGWIGENWGGYGYDVYAFFPEFPPDGDPSNDGIGEDGSVGSPDYDLRVDYQATSADFWRIVDMVQPVILITTSRGGNIGWEIEALEGGHGANNGDDPAYDWTSDKHGAEHFPTEATIDPRSWDAISTYRQGNSLPSQLPMDEILTAAGALGLTNVAIDQGTSGNYLSGFLGLHGVYYNLQTPHNVAAGHIHVGPGLPVADAGALIEATLHAVLQQYPADSVECP